MQKISNVEIRQCSQAKLIPQQQVMKLGFRNNAIDMLICACETLKLCREHPHAFQLL